MQIENQKIGTPMSKLWHGISKWIDKLNTLPGWKEFQRKRFSFAFNYENNTSTKWEGEFEFRFDNETAKQHSVVMAYLELINRLESLKNCEYYFRRYPFKGIPIKRHDYLLNSCELYFNRFYELRERIKILGKAVKIASPNKHLDTGRLIKQYDTAFDEEIKERNRLNHHEKFEDILIDKIFLFSLFENKYDDKSSRYSYDELKVEYRKVCKEWAQRVRKRSVEVEKFIEGIAQEMVNCCSFIEIDASLTDYLNEAENGDIILH